MVDLVCHYKLVSEKASDQKNSASKSKFVSWITQKKIFRNGQGVPCKRLVSISPGWHDKFSRGTGETTTAAKEASEKT